MRVRPVSDLNRSPYTHILAARWPVEKTMGCPIAPSEECRRAATLAHEINNPLDSLLNLLYLMKVELNLTEKGRHYLALAEEEVQRVSQIAHFALDGLRDGERATETDVPGLVRSTVDFYRSRLEAQGISIQTRYCRDGSMMVFAGPLRQAFANLLLNAAAAMPEGGRLMARVSNAREWCGENGQQRCGLRVTFADSGCGIARENMLKILEPFFTTKGADGSGLGLSLVQDVVQEHGGSLHVRSSTRAGRCGSVFAIFLPEK